MRNRIFYQIFFSLMLIFFSLRLHATIFISNTVSGDWNNSLSWLESGVDDLDDIPDGNDTITIAAGHTISVPSAYYAKIKKLTISTTGVLNLVSGSSFGFWSDPLGSTLVLDGQITGTCTLISASKTFISGSGTLGPNISYTVANNCTIENNANITFPSTVYIQGGADFIIEPGSTITLNKFYSNSSASLLKNYGTLIFNSHDIFKTGQGSSVVFYNYAGSSVEYAATSSFSGDFPIPNTGYYNLTISGTADCDDDFTVYENFSNNGTFTSSVLGNNITFAGTSAQLFSGTGTNNFKSITLNNSNGLSLTGTGSINIEEVMESISGAFTQNGPSIVLLSNTDNAAGIVKVSSPSGYVYNSGSFTAERYFNATSDGWRMISCPIKSSTLAEVDHEFIFCGISGGSAGNNYSLSACAGFSNVLTYSTATDTYNDISSINQSISGGDGTLIYTSAGAYTLSMTNGGSRSPNFDNINYPISNSGNAFNLVSNPYPATLDWSVFQAANPIQATYYIYSGDAGNFLSSSADIPHSQGFFIEANSSGTASFNTNQTISSQASFVKSVNGINEPLKLTLSSNSISYFDHAYLNSGSDFTINYDSSYELKEFFTPNPDYAPNIFFVDNDTNCIDRMYINNNQSVDVYFDANIGSLAHGNYTIDFKNLKQFMIGSCLLLEDLHNGVVTDLRQDSLYSFNSDTLAPSPRFKLNISVDYDINVSNNLCFQDSTAFVSLTGPSLHGSYFNLIDSNGVVIDSLLANSDSISFDGLNAGTYNIITNHSGSCSMSNQEIIIIEPEEVVANFLTFVDTIYVDTSGFASVAFKNLSSGSFYFSWDFGDGNTSSEINPIHTFSYPGIYNVQLTANRDSLGTCSDFNQKTIVVIDPFLGIKEESSSGLSLNYSNNILNVQLSGSIDNYKSFVILDANGRQVSHGKITSSNQLIDLSNFSSGFYFISIEDKVSNFINKQFVKFD